MGVLRQAHARRPVMGVGFAPGRIGFRAGRPNLRLVLAFSLVSARLTQGQAGGADVLSAMPGI
jgi:hypothetical protein